jgi:hypothetical protein
MEAGLFEWVDATLTSAYCFKAIHPRCAVNYRWMFAISQRIVFKKIKPLFSLCITVVLTDGKN